jgi:hypothetical protein
VTTPTRSLLPPKFSARGATDGEAPTKGGRGQSARDDARARLGSWFVVSNPCRSL